MLEWAGCVFNTLFTALPQCGSQSDSAFHQICIEGNIASGKTTCLDYFAQTTNIEVLDAHFFVLISISEQLLVLDPTCPWVHEEGAAGAEPGACWGITPNFIVKLQQRNVDQMWCILDAKISVKPVNQSLYLYKITATPRAWACLDLPVCHFMSLKP